MNNILDALIAAKLAGGGGGGGGSDSAVLYTEQTLTADQQAQARANIGAGTPIDVDTELSAHSTNPVQNRTLALALSAMYEALTEKESKATVEFISETTAIITPAANTIYNCDELTSLTITNPPASGAYSIVFTSGSTPTVTTFPATILGLEDFAPEANTLYEINVLDNRAVVGSWAVTS